VHVQALIKPARCWNSPTWKCISSDEMGWKLSCWQLDVPSGIFWAARSHAQSVPVQVYDIDLEDGAQRDYV
jgi:hypothetical protein